MSDVAFINLFKEACVKCFGTPLSAPLSEADSKLLSTKILEETGLVIGAKSIKNYSAYVVNGTDSRKENPSVATLDTFARYVMGAPYTDEVKRKESAGHFPYWYDYKKKFSGSETRTPWSRQFKIALLITGLSVIAAIAYYSSGISVRISDEPDFFVENFNSTHNDSLRHHGWKLINANKEWWDKRNTRPGYLSLYTLIGDNTDSSRISNIMAREIERACFTAEIHMNEFVPNVNWQQVGLLLSEDSTFRNRTLRLSLAYNDFFGGYQKSPEIIIQAISSVEAGNKTKPEEFVHLPLFTLAKGEANLVTENLSKTTLKIEKNGNHFRFLYAAGPMENFAFKEAISRNFDFNPKYVGVFASQGLAQNAEVSAADLDSFSLYQHDCDND